MDLGKCSRKRFIASLSLNAQRLMPLVPWRKPGRYKCRLRSPQSAKQHSVKRYSNKFVPSHISNEKYRNWTLRETYFAERRADSQCAVQICDGLNPDTLSRRPWGPTIRRREKPRVRVGFGPCSSLFLLFCHHLLEINPRTTNHLEWHQVIIIVSTLSSGHRCIQGLSPAGTSTDTDFRNAL